MLGDVIVMLTLKKKSTIDRVHRTVSVRSIGPCHTGSPPWKTSEITFESSFDHLQLNPDRLTLYFSSKALPLPLEGDHTTFKLKCWIEPPLFFSSKSKWGKFFFLFFYRFWGGWDEGLWCYGSNSWLWRWFLENLKDIWMKFRNCYD